MSDQIPPPRALTSATPESLLPDSQRPRKDGSDLGIDVGAVVCTSGPDGRLVDYDTLLEWIIGRTDAVLRAAADYPRAAAYGGVGYPAVRWAARDAIERSLAEVETLMGYAGLGRQTLTCAIWQIKGVQAWAATLRLRDALEPFHRGTVKKGTGRLTIRPEMLAALEDAILAMRAVPTTAPAPRVERLSPAHCRLAVSGGGLTLDGAPVPLKATAERVSIVLHIMADLIEHPGVWRTGSEIAKDAPAVLCINGRLMTRYLKALPDDVRDTFVDSDRKKGYILAEAAWRR